MRHTRCAVVFLALLVALLDSGAATAQTPETLAGTCQIRFVGESTLHDFTGTAPLQPFTVNAVPDATTYRGIVRVPVALLDTDNSWRDDKLRDLFEAERYPDIVASFESIDPKLARPVTDGPTGTLPFHLRIRDVERPVQAALSNWSETASHVAFDAKFTVSLAQFNLQAPSVAGLVRVDDSVEVVVHVDLSAAAPTSAAAPR